jgi:hypothetical protein
VWELGELVEDEGEVVDGCTEAESAEVGAGRREGREKSVVGGEAVGGGRLESFEARSVRFEERYEVGGEELVLFQGEVAEGVGRSTSGEKFVEVGEGHFDVLDERKLERLEPLPRDDRVFVRHPDSRFKDEPSQAFPARRQLGEVPSCPYRRSPLVLDVYVDVDDPRRFRRRSFAKGKRVEGGERMEGDEEIGLIDLGDEGDGEGAEVGTGGDELHR